MTWLIYAVGSAISFAALNLLTRVVSVESRDQRLLSVVFNFFAVIMATAYFFLSGSFREFTLPSDVIAYAYLVVACLFFGLWERLRFVAAKAVEASLLAIINNLSVVVAFFIAILIYSEPLTVNKFLGFVLIIGSLVLVSYSHFKKIDRKGLLIAVGANVILGIGWSLDKKGIGYFNAATYSFLAWLIPLAVIIFPSVNLTQLKKEFQISTWKIPLLAAINVFGYLINLKAQEIAEATKVIPIVQTSTIITVMLGVVFLRERSNLARKAIAGIIAVAGVFLLV